MYWSVILINSLQLNSWDFLLGDHIGPQWSDSRVDQFYIYLQVLSEGIYSV